MDDNYLSERSGKKFRLNAKLLFLTYSRISLSRKDCLKQLELKFENNKIVEYLISQEIHNEVPLHDGASEYHLHVYLKLEKRIK